MLDSPSALKEHGRAVPYLGGMAVAAGVAAAMAGYPGAMPDELRSLLIGTSAMLCMGLADDLRPISPYVKLLFQFLATTIAISGGLHVSIHVLPPAVNFILTYLWMMAITNAFNIIDVHDGLCSGAAAVIGVGLLLVSVFTELYDKTFVTVSSAALVGGTAAFFLANHPPATQFLGDAGSLSIGFLLAGLAIGESYTPGHSVGLLVPFMVFILPLYDLVFVVILRLMKGQSPIRGSPDHVAVRLRKMGWSDRKVLWSLLGLGAAGAVLAPGVVFCPLPYAAFIAACAIAAAVGIGAALARIRVT